MKDHSGSVLSRFGANLFLLGVSEVRVNFHVCACLPWAAVVL